MKQTKIIPFDWEYYQANKGKCRVITSHDIPKEVSQLTKFQVGEGEYCLAGVFDDTLYAWLLNGAYSLSNQYEQRNLQLEVTEEVVESWVNVYEFNNGKRDIGEIRDSKQECLSIMFEHDERKYICTLPLHELKEDEA